MKMGNPLWAGSVLLVLLVLSNPAKFLSGFTTGVLIGVAAVVLLLYPYLLHQHERRLSALERAREPVPDQHH